MAINKVINNPAKTHAAMRSLIRYVLKDEKVQDGYVMVQGPFNYDVINTENVTQAFIDEKQLWNKDSGRMCAHNVISFHPDDYVTERECLEIGQDFCQEFFSDFQSLIAVHQDKDHLHVHIVTNTVSFVDGHKLHQTKKDLQRQKDFTNKLCRDRALPVAEKGKHFDGTEIEPGEIRAWSKDKYQVLTNMDRDSYMIDCAKAIVETVPECTGADDFFVKMEHRGWLVSWNEKRTHIILRNTAGKTVRQANLAGAFTFNIDLGGLIYEFERTIGTYNRTEGSFEDFYAGQAELLLKCIAELFIAAIRATLNSAEHSGADSGAGSGKTRSSGQGRRTARDEAAKFDSFLAEFKAQADAGRAGTELAVRKTDYAIADSQADRRDVAAETSDAAARDDVSKRIARERRSEERMRYSHKKTSERGLG